MAKSERFEPDDETIKCPFPLCGERVAIGADARHDMFARCECGAGIALGHDSMQHNDRWYVEEWTPPAFALTGVGMGGRTATALVRQFDGTEIERVIGMLDKALDAAKALVSLRGVRGATVRDDGGLVCLSTQLLPSAEYAARLWASAQLGNPAIVEGAFDYEKSDIDTDHPTRIRWMDVRIGGVTVARVQHAPEIAEGPMPAADAWRPSDASEAVRS